MCTSNSIFSLCGESSRFFSISAQLEAFSSSWPEVRFLKKSRPGLAILKFPFLLGTSLVSSGGSENQVDLQVAQKSAMALMKRHGTPTSMRKTHFFKLNQVDLSTFSTSAHYS